jgi:hypothetical protein
MGEMGAKDDEQKLFDLGRTLLFEIAICNIKGKIRMILQIARKKMFAK